MCFEIYFCFIDMKKIFATIAVLAVAASSAFAQISVGAGYVGTTATTEINSNSSDATYSGFYVGGNYNINLGMGIGVAPGLYYVNSSSSKDAAAKAFGYTLGTGNVKVKENFLAVPIHLNYGIELTDGLKLSVFAGPTLTFALSSKTDGTLTVLGVSADKTYDNFDEDNNVLDYKRFDVMLGGGVAVDIVDMIRVSAGYNWGLIDLYGNDNAKYTRKGLHVGVAYLF